MPQEDLPVEYVKNQFEDAAQRIRFQHDYTLAGFKTLFLLQGGAIVALLTYAGHSPDTSVARGFSAAFGWYLAGLVSTVVGYLLAYVSQGAFANESMHEAFKHMGWQANTKTTAAGLNRKGRLFVNAAIVVCVFSLLSFALGSYCAFSALR